MDAHAHGVSPLTILTTTTPSPSTPSPGTPRFSTSATLQNRESPGHLTFRDMSTSRRLRLEQRLTGPLVAAPTLRQPTATPLRIAPTLLAPGQARTPMEALRPSLPIQRSSSTVCRLSKARGLTWRQSARQ